MFFEKMIQTFQTGHITDNFPVYLAYTLLFFAIVVGITAIPSASYGLDYQGARSDSEATAHSLSQGNATSQHYGDMCAHYLKGDYNFARNLRERQRIAYDEAKNRGAGFVLGFSIALGPDSVRDGNTDRLRFDIASTDTMNGPVSGFAAYRDCRRRNMLQELR